MLTRTSWAAGQAMIGQKWHRCIKTIRSPSYRISCGKTVWNFLRRFSIILKIHIGEIVFWPNIPLDSEGVLFSCIFFLHLLMLLYISGLTLMVGITARFSWLGTIFSPGGESIANSKRTDGVNRNRGDRININRNIRAKEVRVIDPDGNQIGVIPTYKAIAVANDFGLDLVEISPYQWALLPRRFK